MAFCRFDAKQLCDGDKILVFGETRLCNNLAVEWIETYGWEIPPFVAREIHMQCHVCGSHLACPKCALRAASKIGSPGKLNLTLISSDQQSRLDFLEFDWVLKFTPSTFEGHQVWFLQEIGGKKKRPNS